MNQETLMRQLDIIPMDKLGQKLSIVGAGAIGGNAIMALTKMGFGEVEVWDFDGVDSVNINCQPYRTSDIGKAKVLALAEIVKDFSGFDITVHHKKWEGERLTGIVIAAVDSMAVRKAIWERVKGDHMVTHLIDPRMSAEMALCYVIDPNCEKDVVSYEKTLYTDADAVQERCTAKSTMYTAGLIGCHVAKQVKDLVTNARYEDGPAYSRITHWDIKNNQLLTWRK